MKTTIESFFSIISTTFIYLVGGLDIALKSLLIIIALDYVSGVLSAIYNKKLNSKIGLKGILKKFGYLVVVALSVMLDKITGESGIIRNLVIYFFIANDGISIVENMGKMGIKLPKKLTDCLEQLKKEDDE